MNKSMLRDERGERDKREVVSILMLKGGWEMGIRRVIVGGLMNV
ncbi:MAG: hypothetical protein ACJ748_07620 [Flavisolibacter sp.]